MSFQSRYHPPPEKLVEIVYISLQKVTWQHQKKLYR